MRSVCDAELVMEEGEDDLQPGLLPLPMLLPDPGELPLPKLLPEPGELPEALPFPLLLPLPLLPLPFPTIEPKMPFSIFPPSACGVYAVGRAAAEATAMARIAAIRILKWFEEDGSEYELLERKRLGKIWLEVNGNSKGVEDGEAWTGGDYKGYLQSRSSAAPHCVQSIAGLLACAARVLRVIDSTAWTLNAEVRLVRLASCTSYAVQRMPPLRIAVAYDSWRPTLPIEAIPASTGIAMTVERSLEEERYAISQRSTACSSDISTASSSATLEIADRRVTDGSDLEF